ncbi:OmpA family protein [Psychromonas sp. KJ10-10]|uniref:OmpA family protein n=1 Tax=Psychromonas sp. KJ10-10 TaxID=3391823 RepID=UPI0039B38FEF
MSVIKILVLMVSVVFLSACSSLFEGQHQSEETMPVSKPVITPKTPEVVQEPGIEVLSSCLHYVLIEGDKFIGYKPRYFHFDESEPIEKADEQMQCIADLLNDYPEQSMEIRGHADTKGSERYNLLLSAKRSAFIEKELLTLGTSNKQLTSMALGESEPVSENSTEPRASIK